MAICCGSPDLPGQVKWQDGNLGRPIDQGTASRDHRNSCRFGNGVFHSMLGKDLEMSNLYSHSPANGREMIDIDYGFVLTQIRFHTVNPRTV